MKTQNGPPMTVHTKARIPAVMDTVVTDRVDLDLDISQGAINGYDFTTTSLSNQRRLYHSLPPLLQNPPLTCHDSKGIGHGESLEKSRSVPCQRVCPPWTMAAVCVN